MSEASSFGLPPIASLPPPGADGVGPDIDRARPLPAAASGGPEFANAPAASWDDWFDGTSVPGGKTLDLRGLTAPAARHVSTTNFTVQEAPHRHHIESEIGRGGMGVVHLGWDLQLERPVAAKVLLESHKGRPEVVRRFREEARITSRLQHPGIVAIHDLGITPDGRPYFVMELVRGQTLEHILSAREDPIADLPRLLTTFLQVCQTIAYAHSQGVIHRDLKPANIMVGAFGVVKVMDWGLAKFLGEPELPDAVAAARFAAELSTRCDPRDPLRADPSVPGTQVGTVFGTPAYLPPEQARGEIDQVDKRADVFGLGSILCEILTGRPPFIGADGREIYKKAAAARVDDAMARLNACPLPLDILSLAKWCLSPDPRDRPADAGDVVEVMTAYLQSDQRRAEQDLVRFFDLSPDVFCIAGTDGHFRRFNETLPGLLGRTASELKAHPFIDFVHPEDREHTRAVYDRLCAGGSCVHFVNRYRHARGHYLGLEWNALAVPEEQAIYAVARDVTGRLGPAETAAGPAD